MPEIGDTARAKEIGKAGRGIYIWAACPDCNMGRWKRYRDVGRRCGSCAATKARLDLQLPGLQVKRAGELGYKGRSYLYAERCPNCGEVQWRPKHHLGLGMRCGKCNCKHHSSRLSAQRGEKSPRWTGGRYICKRTGYVFIRLQPEDPFFCMADKVNHRVAEHRLVIAEDLGRPLDAWEVVHHKKEPKDDNRRENLVHYELQAEHLPSIFIVQELERVKQRAELLEKENAALRAEVTELKKRVTVVEGEAVVRRYSGIE